MPLYENHVVTSYPLSKINKPETGRPILFRKTQTE